MKRIKRHQIRVSHMEILDILLESFAKGQRQPKSTFVNAILNKRLGKTVHANNFRTTCKLLEQRGFLMRKKIELDWYLNITPNGVDLVSNMQRVKE